MACLNPCSECPFRRKSAPGWIGGHADVREIIDIVEGDGRFPCHQSVNRLIRGGGRFLRAVRESKPCIGALAFMKNHAKLSRDPDLAELQRAVGKRADVFASVAEMVGHHRRSPSLDYAPRPLARYLFAVGDAVAARFKDVHGYQYVVGEVKRVSHDTVDVRTWNGTNVSYPARILTKLHTVWADSLTEVTEDEQKAERRGRRVRKDAQVPEVQERGVPEGRGRTG